MIEGRNVLLVGVGEQANIAASRLEQEHGCTVVNLGKLMDAEGFSPADTAAQRWQRIILRMLLDCDAVVSPPNGHDNELFDVVFTVAPRIGVDVFEVDVDGQFRPVTVPQRSHKDILEEAKTLVEGQRQSEYGHPTSDLSCTAAMWTAYLSRLGHGAAVTARDVCAMMILLKLSRSVTSPTVRDHWVDTCGYAYIAADKL